MMKNIELPKSKIIQKRPKRTFSLEDKLKLYEQWRKSGLSMSKFCKENDLVHSAFGNWRKKFSIEQTIGNKEHWIPVVAKEQPLKDNFLHVEISFPNTIKVLISLLLFFMVLSYAIKVIW